MKTFILSMLLLVSGANAATTIKYFSDYPNNPNPPDFFIMPLETGDHSVGGIPYNWWNLSQVKAWLVINGFSNATVNIIYVTNLFVTNIVANSITVVTNINQYTTITQPGGFTNDNLAPNSIVATDPFDGQTSIANGTGLLSNNGSGTFVWVLNNFLKNLTDQGTNLTLWFPTMYATATFLKTNSTDLNIAVYDGANVLQGWNDGTNWSGAAAGLTNITYQYKTNTSGLTTLGWGLAYRTNLAADVTLSLASLTSAAASPFYQTTVYWVTNNSGSNHKVTSPTGVIGPVGSGTPAVLWCTNNTITRLLYEHFGPADVTVSKTDFGP